MQSHTANHFRHVRIQKGISLGQLARRVGYRNVNKGCRRITSFEKTGQVTDDLFTRLAQSLNINEATITALKERDREELEKWLSEPIDPYLVIRFFAAMYANKDLPEHIADVDQAKLWACDFARQINKRVCLVWSRKTVIYFDDAGQIERSATSVIPSMTVGGRSLNFYLSDDLDSQVPDKDDLFLVDEHFGLRRGTTFKVVCLHRDPSLLNKKLSKFGIRLDQYGMVPKDQRPQWRIFMQQLRVGTEYWKDPDLLVPEMEIEDV